MSDPNASTKPPTKIAMMTKTGGAKSQPPNGAALGERKGDCGDRVDEVIGDTTPSTTMSRKSIVQALGNCARRCSAKRSAAAINNTKVVSPKRQKSFPPPTVSVLAGSGKPGCIDDIGESAEFHYPRYPVVCGDGRSVVLSG